MLPAATAVALTVFGLFSWWTLWGEGVEHVAVPDGFLWTCSVVAAGVLVAGWLARWGSSAFSGAPPRVREWLGSDSGLLVGVVLLIPGGACWFALRAVLALRTGRASDRGSRKGRGVRAILWMLWSSSGLAGQLVFVLFVLAVGSHVSGTGLGPDIAWSGAALINALSMLVLIGLEPGADLVRNRGARIAGLS